jgi:hypothetical protein
MSAKGSVTPPPAKGSDYAKNDRPRRALYKQSRQEFEKAFLPCLKRQTAENPPFVTVPGF